MYCMGSCEYVIWQYTVHTSIYAVLYQLWVWYTAWYEGKLNMQCSIMQCCIMQAEVASSRQETILNLMRVPMQNKVYYLYFYVFCNFEVIKLKKPSFIAFMGKKPVFQGWLGWYKREHALDRKLRNRSMLKIKLYFPIPVRRYIILGSPVRVSPKTNSFVYLIGFEFFSSDCFYRRTFLPLFFKFAHWFSPFELMLGCAPLSKV